MLIVLGVLSLSGGCCIWSVVKLYEIGAATEVTQPENTPPPPAAADGAPGDDATEEAADPEPEPVEAPAPQKAQPKPRAKPIRD